MTRVSTLILSLTCGVGTAFAALPITFEENRGQVPPEVVFLSRAAGYRVFLTRQGAVITLNDGQAVRISLANSRATPLGMHLLAAETNYLLGVDPASWRTGIANYGRVTYRQAYPGIDMTWHARGDQVEQDFLVSAGADPRRIRLVFAGAALRLTPEGDLMAGSLSFHKPHAYQDGRDLECQYELHGHSVRFALGAYDHTRPLTIDPVLSFSTYLGTGTPAATALDGAGNLYVVGTTASLGFPGTAGTLRPAPVGDSCVTIGPFGPPLGGPCTDIFIAKLSGDGQTLLYATYLGGPRDDSATAIAVGPAGNLYIAGVTESPTTFPKLAPLPGQSLGPFFVAELSADGSSLLYATSLPVGIPPWVPVGPSALAVDASGAVYLTGRTFGGLPTVNAFQPAPADADLFQTVDQGSHWRGVATGLSPVLGSSGFRTIVADPSTPQVLYVITLDGRLYKSTDGGAHWTSIKDGIQYSIIDGIQDSPLSIVVDPRTPQTLYVGMYGASSVTVYKSTDGGATWAGSAGAGKYVWGMAVDPANQSVVYAGTSNGLYKSTDGAATWNLTGLHVPISGQVVIDPTNTSTIYAATSPVPEKSTDGGKTWTALTNGFAQHAQVVTSLALDPVNPQTLYAGLTSDNPPAAAAAGGWVGVYKTSDGGATWTPVVMPTRCSFVNFLLLDPALHSRVWAAGSGVCISQDSGASWSVTALPHIYVPALARDSAGGVYAVRDGLPEGDAFVMKLDATGSNIVYSTYLGGMGVDIPGGIAADAAGRAYIAGETDSTDFPLAAPFQASFGGNSDVFVTVLDPTGSRLVWSTYVGGSAAEGARSIALDASGDVHLAGTTTPASPFLGFFAGSRDPAADAFAAKIKGDGSALIYSAHLGGSDQDTARSVAADAAGNTYIAGVTYSKDLPTVNAVQTTLAGAYDALVAKFDGRTGAVQYATYLGGTAADDARGVAADGPGNAYVTGVTGSSDFPLKNPWRSGLGTMFVTKLSAQDTGARVNGLTNAASYTATVAPGELVSIFGAGLAVSNASAAQPPLPTQLSDAQVTVNGVSAPLIYASPQQVNAQIPFETPAGPAQVQVSSSAGTSAITVQVAPVAPAIFTLNQQGTGPGAILHGTSFQVVNDSNPATAGEITSIYCTGLGAVSPLAQTGATPPDPPSQTVIPVQVSIGGVAAQVLYQGVAPGFPGLYQVNAQIPAGTPSGAQPLQIIQNGAASNTVTLAVQ